MVGVKNVRKATLGWYERLPRRDEGGTDLRDYEMKIPKVHG